MSKKQKPLDEYYHRQRLKYAFAGAFGLLFAIVSILYLALSHASGNVAPAQTYVWTYPPTTNLTQSGYNLTINKVDNLGSASYFWSHEVYFVNPPAAGGGTAYIGLQGTNAAVFSVFGASLSSSSSCKVYTSGFDNGAYSYGGTSCIIDYPVTAGGTYKLSIADVSNSTINGTLYFDWRGTVINTANNQTTVLGDIDVPFSWELLTNQVVNWTEYFGPTVTSCAAYPYSNVTFSNFTFNNGQYTQPSSFSENITQNDCTGTSSITENSINSFTEQMGTVQSPPASTPPATGSSGSTGTKTSTGTSTAKIITKSSAPQPTQQSTPSPSTASAPKSSNAGSGSTGTSTSSSGGSSLPPTQSESTPSTSSTVKLHKAADYTTVGGAILVVLCVFGVLIEQHLYHKHRVARSAHEKSDFTDNAPPSSRHKYPW